MKQSNEKNLWLVQVYDDGQFFLYHWTPIQAKKGYRVLTDEQAQPLLKLIQKKENFILPGSDQDLIDLVGKTTNEKSKMVPVHPDEVEEDTEEVDIVLDDVVSTDVEANNVDEIREISVSQDDLQADELKKIASFRHKSRLEKHMLEKYQLEIPMERLSVMKSVASKMISDLAKEGRLYMADSKFNG